MSAGSDTDAPDTDRYTIKGEPDSWLVDSGLCPVSWNCKEMKQGKTEKSYSGALTDSRRILVTIPSSVIIAIFHSYLLCGNHYNQTIWLLQEKLIESSI